MLSVREKVSRSVMHNTWRQCRSGSAAAAVPQNMAAVPQNIAAVQQRPCRKT